jgi:AraC family transcriptional regulator
MRRMLDFDDFTGDAAPRVRYLDMLSRVVAYIDVHLSETLDGDLLADQAAMSRFHFQRVFRAYFGTTVAGYVTWRRLRRACELLAADPASVLDVAVAAGYDSAQSLAKAMRRELDTTPTAVRAGAEPGWQRLFDRRGAQRIAANDEPLSPQFVEIGEVCALAAMGQGAEGGSMHGAAERAFAELVPAIQAAALKVHVRSWIGILIEEPQGPDDENARLLAGAVFDGTLSGDGAPGEQPRCFLGGTLAWHRLPAGRYAVFTHLGTYRRLHLTWTAIYRDWLPATGYALRDAPPFEHYLTDPLTTAPKKLRADIYIPLQ